MYKPPSEDELHLDDESAGEETEKFSPVPPRKSALPRKSTAPGRQEFYADEHPEIPRVRRASLKEVRVETLSRADQEDLSTHIPGEIDQHARTTKKRVRDPMLPLTGLETRDELLTQQGEVARYGRTSLKRHQEDMQSFDGLETMNEDAMDTAVWEKLTRDTQSVSRVSPRTGKIRPVGSPPRPVAGREPTTGYAGLVYLKVAPLLKRRATWVLLGLLIIVVLVITPLLSNSTLLHNNGLVINNQNYSFPRLPSVGSNTHELVVTPPLTDHPAPPVLASSAYLLDTDNETTLYAQNPFLHLPMLSTTKLMTAVLAVENGKLDQQVTITPEIEQQINQLSADSTLFGVKQDETYTLRDLLYGLLYFSGNDAALVIANAVSGSVSNFVGLMNSLAQSLGMHDTHFVNPHGLLEPGQYSCAHDLAILGQYSLGIPTIQQMSSGRTYHIAAGGNHGERVLVNENQFLWWYPGVTGGKTGYDGASDFVQVMEVTRNHRHLIGVVMHTNDWWTDMRDLMNYGSTDYTWASPRDVEVSGQPIPYDNLWNYFTRDTRQDALPIANQGLYYVYSGYSVSGPILSYFNQQGGLQKFGFPMQMPVPSASSVMSQHFQKGTISCDFFTNQCHMTS